MLGALSQTGMIGSDSFLWHHSALIDYTFGMGAMRSEREENILKETPS